jgi:FixJ family two-component response regulator
MDPDAQTPYLVSVVDDDTAVRSSLGNLLESAGLTAESFASAEEFLTASQADRRSCLILDVQLPEMNGIELQQFLLKNRDAVPVIFITAYTDNNQRAQALRDGAMGFFHKPFDAEAVLAAVQTAVSLSAQRNN